jgi:hypothetical protein
MTKGTALTGVGLAVVCAFGISACSSTPAKLSATTTAVHPTPTTAVHPTPTTAVPPTPATAVPPTPTAAVPPTTTTAVLPTTSLTTIAVTGTGPASSITIDLGGQETQHTDVPLPWSMKVPADYSGSISVHAQDGSGAGAATITCTISDNSGTVQTAKSTGPHAVTTCEGAG